ncbi:Transcriptional protein swt1 [Smittium mucronatum]|uniref:Transcriptional protein swt1 n=1 Tax=Smittium mucronatum TaxID=133383 RepID=A0A1R0H2M7_9FUNG|nr:Transcriptional protein swt1 [Smittium mucronatum]
MENSQANKKITFVVDTNYLISAFDFLVGIYNFIKKHDLSNFQIVIPFIVLGELDGIHKRTRKHGAVRPPKISESNTSQYFLHHRVKDSISFLSTNSGNSFLRGQKIDETLIKNNLSTVADDLILDCCRYYMVCEQKRVALLTFDKNLSLKAKFNEVEVFGFSNVSYLEFLKRASGLNPLKKESIGLAKSNPNYNSSNLSEKRKISKAQNTSSLEIVEVTDNSDSYNHATSKRIIKKAKNPYVKHSSSLKNAEIIFNSVNNSITHSPIASQFANHGLLLSKKILPIPPKSSHKAQKLPDFSQFLPPSEITLSTNFDLNHISNNFGYKNEVIYDNPQPPSSNKSSPSPISDTSRFHLNEISNIELSEINLRPKIMHPKNLFSSLELSSDSDPELFGANLFDSSNSNLQSTSINTEAHKFGLNITLEPKTNPLDINQDYYIIISD